MNRYERWVLPYLLDLAMHNKEVTRYRSRVVPCALGIVAEVGIGSGLNFRFYGPQVRGLYGIDPSERLLRMARSRAAQLTFPVDFLLGSGESLPIADGSIDTVLTTFTLCTVSDPHAALREMRRVLKPSGQLLFAEHGLAPDIGVQRWQQRCNRPWCHIAGGCNLNRRMDALIVDADFRVVEVTREYAKGPRILSYIYAGLARPQ